MTKKQREAYDKKKEDKLLALIDRLIENARSIKAIAKQKEPKWKTDKK